MNNLTDFTKTFKKVDDWQEFVKNNFDRNSGSYSSVTVTEIEVHYKKQIFRYPTKIVFEYGYVKTQKNIIKNERLLNNKQVKVVEKQQIIPLGLYKRDKEFSGDISQIITDILDNNKIESGSFSGDLLTPNDNPFYSIDSKQQWSSYLLVLKKENKLYEKDTNCEEINFLNDILDDYGIHYSFENSLQDHVLVIFPMPFLKIVENRIRKEKDNKDIDEYLFLVIEFNLLPFFFTSQVKIEIDGLIKDLKGETIYQKTKIIKCDKAKYQTVDIVPKQQSKIGYAEFAVKINGAVVDKFSGYYFCAFVYQR